jgi:hypothetical protein
MHTHARLEGTTLKSTRACRLLRVCACSCVCVLLLRVSGGMGAGNSREVVIGALRTLQEGSVDAPTLSGVVAALLEKNIPSADVFEGVSVAALRSLFRGRPRMSAVLVAQVCRADAERERARARVCVCVCVCMCALVIVRKRFARVCVRSCALLAHPSPSRSVQLIEKLYSAAVLLRTNTSDAEVCRAMNCARLLTRMLPVLFEDRASWIFSLLWDNEFPVAAGTPHTHACVRTRRGLHPAHALRGADGEPTPSASLPEDRVVEPHLPLGRLLVDAAMMLLFTPRVTCPAPARADDPFALLWYSGLGATYAGTSSKVMVGRRIELMRLLLVLFSPPLYVPHAEADATDARLAAHACSIDCPNTLLLWVLAAQHRRALRPDRLGRAVRHVLCRRLARAGAAARCRDAQRAARPRPQRQHLAGRRVGVVPGGRVRGPPPPRPPRVPLRRRRRARRRRSRPRRASS